jgi:hypothetical protein
VKRTIHCGRASREQSPQWGGFSSELFLICLTPRSGSGWRAKPDGRSAAAWIREQTLIREIKFREKLCLIPIPPKRIAPWAAKHELKMQPAS